MFESSKNLKSTKYLAIIAIMISLKLIVGSRYIPIANNLRISFKFLVVAVESSIIGPIPALLSGFITDLIGFLIYGNGQFFLGYTLNEMLGGFIFALFLYNTNISILKLAFSKTIINYFINVMLGSYWASILFNKGYIYQLSKSIIKNSMLLPIEIIMLVLLFNLLIPLLSRRKLIKNNKVPIKFM